MTIRGKFRLLSIKAVFDGTHVLQFAPVKRTKEGVDVDSENNVFWQYTPNGEAQLTIKRGADPIPFVVGAYYFLDLDSAGEHDRNTVLAVEGGAVVIAVEDTSYAMKVSLEAPWEGIRVVNLFDGTEAPTKIRHLGFSVRLDLSPQAEAARTSLAKRGERFIASFTFAEDSDHPGA